MQLPCPKCLTALKNNGGCSSELILYLNNAIRRINDAALHDLVSNLLDTCYCGDVWLPQEDLNFHVVTANGNLNTANIMKRSIEEASRLANSRDPADRWEGSLASLVCIPPSVTKE